MRITIKSLQDQLKNLQNQLACNDTEYYTTQANMRSEISSLREQLKEANWQLEIAFNQRDAIAAGLTLAIRENRSNARKVREYKEREQGIPMGVNPDYKGT